MDSSLGSSTEWPVDHRMNQCIGSLIKQSTRIEWLGGWGLCSIDWVAQEVGRALRMTARAAAFLFPEAAPAEQGAPVRLTVTVVDEGGVDWPMMFVCKRYVVG